MYRTWLFDWLRVRVGLEGEIHRDQDGKTITYGKIAPYQVLP